jgi:ABC-type glutathione transport system ATPase component
VTSDETQTSPGTGSLLSINDLSIDFTTGGNAACVVDGVSFTVGSGEIVALVGESGSGKSVSGLSMLGLLPRNARPSGSIMFGGVELSGYDEKRWRELRGSRIAMIFQDPGASLDPSFTIGSQLREAIKLHNRALSSAACKQRAIELLGALGIADPERRLTQYPHQLSGGQCQRVMIALALIGEPDLLIADEPTTALDVTVQAEILEVLRDLRETRNMSILLITHDMGVVADIADRVVVMRDGRVEETQQVDQLFAAPEQDYTKALLAAVPRIGEAPPRATTPRSPARRVLEVNDLVIEYTNRRRESVRAVDGVTMTVARGEIVGLVGESGSGKSSIGRAIVGMTPITAGTITVSGEDISQLRRRKLRKARRKVGMVFQNPLTSLNPRYTVRDTLEEPLRTQLGLKGTDLRERVDALLTSVGLGPHWRDRYPHELSGGQRQRVAIARGISLDPDLLIADEPTSALDVSVQAHVIDLFRDLQANLGFGCLFISHDLAVVDSLCDRVAVIQHGHIVEEGPHNQVLSNPAHPYTQNLINSAPVPDPASQRARREQLRGGRAERSNRRLQLTATPPEPPDLPAASYR